MGLFTELHTFGNWAEKELGKLANDQPKIEAVADTVLQYVGGAATIIAGLEGGPAASTLVTGAINTIKAGSVALNGLITDFGATPTAVSIATSLSANANELLAAGAIKNPASVTAAKAIITNLTSLTTALTNAATPAAS